MPEYRRSNISGGTYFFTVVTYHRQPILTTKESRHILRSAWVNVMERYPFTIDAICLLPDHLHCIWTLPDEDMNYSLRWGEIKKLFSKEYLKRIGVKEIRNESRIKRGEAAVWQRRFWEHTIKDETDLNMHLDYIHFNPVKHGLVENIVDWPWSSFHRYLNMGYYDKEWGNNAQKTFEKLSCGE
jgi:putative transposase